ncbi:MAG: pyridoxal phosphate-dependent aminotransferase [Acidimicrobiia bacterium]|nr:pyridoxal phosphate-dependent aminotransferase [Acidimicrobiia bacterium]NNF68363.1 pyridoxal phosphate-dependent aminotransferase [Acidimicrobiia bacterium]
MKLSRRVENITESATLAITAKANALRAAGSAVIGFGAGEPDFPTPPHIVEAAQAAAADPRNHRYTPAGGLPDLRQAVADKTKRDSGYEIDPAQVVVTNGGKHAVYATMQVLVDDGDEVLLPSPYWVTYPEVIKLAGGTPVVVPTTDASGYRVTVDQLEAAATERTKLLVFVSPSNPTGAVYPPEEVAAIGRWAADRGIWVMTDEIYEHLVYGDAVHASMPVVAPELERCVVVNGVAKTYAMTGWRVGWMIGPSEVAKAAIRLQSHATSNVANVSQRAALAAVTGSLADVDRMRAAFDRRRRTMVEMLQSIPGVTCPEPEGAFYAFPNLAGLLDRDLQGRSAATTLELADLLLDEVAVAVVPGEAFGAPGYARLSFALGDDDLVEGLSRIRDLAG